MLRFSALTVVLAIPLLVFAGCGGSSSTPTPTPSPAHGAGSWSAEFTGAVSGSLSDQDALTSCSESDASFQIALYGSVNGSSVSITLGVVASGSYDYAKLSSGLAITAKYTPMSGEVDFAGNAGATGASGTVTVGGTGNGSLAITIPPSSGSGDPLTVNATWTCG